jgi:two-component system, NtrC family, sensor histidine kinase AtoS
LSAIRTILDQFDHPCILWDQENDKIIQINNHWEVLTNINLDDLINISINDILPKYKESEHNRIDVINIINKDNSIIKCRHKIVPIAGAGKLYLLKFFPLKSSVFKAHNKQDILDEIITRLLELDITGRFLSLAEATIAVINELFDSHFSAIYANNDVVYTDLSIISSFGEKDLFPRKLNSNEVNIQQTIEIWKNGDRALNSLQRIAKQKGISTLATAVIKIDAEHQGLLLLAFKNQFIYESDFFILPILISIIRINFQKAAIFLEHNNKDNKQFLRNEQIDEILNNATIGTLIVDKDKKILFSNTYIELLLGFEKWELSGESLDEIIPYFDDKNLQMIQGQNSGIQNKKLRKRDGSNFPARFLAQRIHTDSLLEEQFQVVFIEDLSELNHLKNEVVQLSRQAEMGVLVASFAHDVRNVFNSIKINADTVQLIASDNFDVSEKMISIKDDCDEVNQLMESVLSFSSSFEKNQKIIDLRFMLERVIDRWKPKLDKLKIQAIVQFDEIPQIMGDARSLEQAFNNLISNARDAMNQKGGTLGIYINRSESTNSDQFVKVSISDSGVGIPEEDLLKIFDPFYSAKSGGTGLGLAITKKIIEYHGGTLNVNSFPGGTTFHAALPIKKAGEK